VPMKVLGLQVERKHVREQPGESGRDVTGCVGVEVSRYAETLVLAGRHDWICPPEFSEEIARLIPGADLRVFERSSHSIRSDEPEAMVDAILGFVVYR